MSDMRHRELSYGTLTHRATSLKLVSRFCDLARNHRPTYRARAQYIPRKAIILGHYITHNDTIGYLKLYGTGDMENSDSTAAIVGPDSQIFISSLPNETSESI
ncbi:hypothetical protein QCA50_020333 [Cerrena zonata]|uniref:Uncharacterized protein n=1 Tax=Cerrena zonata TaxID=2478898 RepID=A0AAW0F9N7_9APHY